MSEHVVSDFKGKDGLLIQSIDSLLEMDAKGILVPHGIGGHARTLLRAAKAAIEQAARTVPVVGEPVAWACPYHAGEVTVNGTPCMLVSANCVNSFGKERGFPLHYVANAIPAADLARLREEAAEANAALKAAQSVPEGEK